MTRLATKFLVAAVLVSSASPVLATPPPKSHAPPRWTLRNEATSLQAALFRGQTAITVRAELRVSPGAVAAAREGRPAQAEAPARTEGDGATQPSYRSAESGFSGPNLFDDSELSWINALTQAEAERAGTAPGQGPAAVVPARADEGVVTRLEVEVTGLPVVTAPDAPVLLGATEPVNLQVVPDALPGAGTAVYSGVSTVTITPDVARACPQRVFPCSDRASRQRRVFRGLREEGAWLAM
jgi:hypothetical protein